MYSADEIQRIFRLMDLDTAEKRINLLASLSVVSEEKDKQEYLNIATSGNSEKPKSSEE
jgi:hypothetical protein